MYRHTRFAHILNMTQQFAVGVVPYQLFECYVRYRSCIFHSHIFSAPIETASNILYQYSPLKLRRFNLLWVCCRWWSGHV